MLIVNETQQTIFYSITNGTSSDCGTVDPLGSQDVGYDNMSNVTVQVSPLGTTNFTMNIPQVGTDELLQFLLEAE